MTEPTKGSIADAVTASRTDQGLPEHVEDPETIRRAGAILRQLVLAHRATTSTTDQK